VKPLLAATTLQAVQLVSPIFLASNVVANLHVLRCLETEGNVSKLDQTFFSDCMYAVTHATGHRAVQFDRAKNVKLRAWTYTSNSYLNIINHQKGQHTLKT